MASLTSNSILDPLHRIRADSPNDIEDEREHLWWNTNADLIEIIWANDDEIRRLLRTPYLIKARNFLTENGFHTAIIFEIGSGSGWVGRLIIQGTQSRLFGIDLSEAQVDIAQTNAKDENLSAQCTYICANLSDAALHIKEQGVINGLVIHAILHHLTWSEINQILSDSVRLGQGAKLFAYEPVFFRKSRGESVRGNIFSGLSRMMAVSCSLCALIIMRLFGRLFSVDRDLNILDRLDRVTKEAVENQFVLSPKEVVFDHRELIETLDRYYTVKKSYLCNYLDTNAAVMASILQKPSRVRWVFLKVFLPILKALDRWLVSSGAIYNLCSGESRGRVIDNFFPRYCFWGVECLPKLDGETNND